MRRAFLVLFFAGCGGDLPAPSLPDLAQGTCPPRYAFAGETGCSDDAECRMHKSGSVCAAGVCCIALRPDEDGGMP